MAEAVRAHMADLNYLKTVAPKTAARIREHVNANLRLKDMIQFDDIAPIVGGGVAAGAAFASGEAKGADPAMLASFPPLPPGFELDTRAMSAAPPPPPGFIREDSAGPAPGAAAPPPLTRQPTMVPEYHAMGNPTGGMIEVPAGPQMGYGEQMARVGRALDDGVHMIANGGSFGLADRVAGVADLAAGNATYYDEGVRGQRARTQEIRNAHPYLAETGEFAGGLLNGFGLVRNGVNLAGRMGEAGLARVLGFMGEGAAYGAGHAVGNTYSDRRQDYDDAALTGGSWGAGFGLALPLAGSAAGKLYRAGSAAMGRPIEESSRAASSLMRAAAQADEAGLRRLPQMGRKPCSSMPGRPCWGSGRAPEPASAPGPPRSSMRRARATPARASA